MTKIKTQKVKRLKNSKCDKTYNVTKLKNLKCDKTKKKLQMWQNKTKTQSFTTQKLKNSKKKKSKYEKKKKKVDQIYHYPELWQNSETKFVTMLIK